MLCHIRQGEGLMVMEDTQAARILQVFGEAAAGEEHRAEESVKHICIFGTNYS